MTETDRILVIGRDKGLWEAYTDDPIVRQALNFWVLDKMTFEEALKAATIALSRERASLISKITKHFKEGTCSPLAIMSTENTK